MMFGNILYFITILLIYTTYQPTPESGGHAMAVGLHFVGLTAAFILFTWIFFRRLAIRYRSAPPVLRDSELDSLITKQSVLAVMLFAVDIYGLELPAYTQRFMLFQIFPTLDALCFLIVSLCYLGIIWASAYPVYRIIQGDAVSSRSYILSNMSFSVPVLLPWIILSSLTDLILLLPFDRIREWFHSPLGELAYFIFFVLAVAIFGPALIQRFWQCKPLEQSAARDHIEAFCQKAGVRFAEILSWPLFGGRMLTAGVLGLTARFRYVLVTPALLRFLSLDELEAVMAHEIGHVKKRHMLFYLFFIAILMPIIFLLYVFTVQLTEIALLYFNPSSTSIGGVGIRWIVDSPIINAAFLVLLFFLSFRFVFGYFMRNFERQADLHVFTYFPSAEHLISSLKKIALVSRQSPDIPNWHHYSIHQRIEYLTRCEWDRRWIRRHNRKVRGSIIIYLALVVLIGGMFFASSGQLLYVHLLEAMLQKADLTDSDKAQLYQQLGDHYYLISEDFKEAIQAYERSIQLQPNAPEALNNLAWLYATCKDPAYRNPQRALTLALQAVALRPSPHILDTLAESLFINGHYEEAFSIEEKAAAQVDPRERSHYESQLKKFHEAILKQQPDSV